MILLPILGRELQIRARGQANYWTRCCVALAGVLICIESMQFNVLGTPPSRMGLLVFNGIVAAAFLVSCSACLLTADAISGEWREGTLSLLFLTRVRVLDVLLGKLGSIGVAAVCALLAFLPVLMVPVLNGGVTGGEALRKALGLLDALFLALVVGLFSSAVERERFHAVRRAITGLSLLVVAPFLAYVGWGRGLFFYAGLISPLVLLLRAGDAAYGTSPWCYWGSLLSIQAISWYLLVRTALHLRRAVASGGRADPDPAPSKETPARAIGLGVWQPIKEEVGPVEWLVYRRSGIHAGIWTLAVLSLAANAWVPLVRQAQGRPAGLFLLAVASPLGTVSGLIGAAALAWVASRFFMGVRRSGDLELLLTTPVGAQRVVADQWQVLKRLFVWPVLFMQAPMLPQFLVGLSAAHGSAAPGLPAGITWVKFLTVLNASLGAAALCWLGLWFGLRCRTQAAAIVWTVGLGQGLPSIIALSGSIWAAVSRAPNATHFGGYVVGWWLPELLNAGVYLWLIGLARRCLTAELTGREEPLRPLRAARTT